MKAIAGEGAPQTAKAVKPVTSAPEGSPVRALERLERPAFLHDGERFVEVNSSWLELAGYQGEEILGLPLRQLLPRAGSRRSDEPLPGPQELVRADGTRRLLFLSEQTLDVPTPWKCLVADSPPIEIEPAPPADRADLTLACLDEAIVRTDPSGRIEYLNPAASSLLGCGSEVIGQPSYLHLRLVDELSGDPLSDPVRRAIAERLRLPTAERATLVRQDRREIAVSGSVSPLFGDNGEVSGAVVELRDVARTRELEREMSYLARHDPLTGLINRRDFEAKLREALVSASENRSEHALLYVDLDQFKLVNDTSGHIAGDEMLKQVAELLLSRLRRSDVLARLGGDEFGLLLFDCTTEAALRVAEDVRTIVRRSRFEWEGQLFEIGASIGLVPIHSGCGDLIEVLRAADAACYVVKDGGGNGVHVYRPDDTAIGFRKGEMEWVQRLHRGLDDSRLRLDYQMIEPIQPGLDRPLCELFVRFVDREGGSHRATAFISAAERFGLMDEIDRWVIRKAFAAIAEADRNRREAISEGIRPAHAVDGFTINLSARSLSSATLFEFVTEELSSSGVDPERVCFEITETAAISHLDRARRLISELRKFGCRFVLDDFGRGLSSFAYLRDLHVDLLKIDGDFIRAMQDDTVNRAMVTSIHQVGKVMGLTTIAEGIENAAVLEEVRRIGVDYAQGYYLHRPEALVHDH